MHCYYGHCLLLISLLHDILYIEVNIERHGPVVKTFDLVVDGTISRIPREVREQGLNHRAGMAPVLREGCDKEEHLS